MNKFLKKLDYNSPVILTYAAVCLALLILDLITVGWLNSTLLVCRPHPNLLDPLTYVRSIMHIFGHSSWSHLFNNMILLLLVGPVVEERYGSWNLAVMILSDAVLTAVINGLFFNTGIIGASGVVFMLIILCAFTNVQKGKIPISLILVSVLYLGKEVYNALFVNDNISQMGHIVGGLVGLGWGIYYHYRKFRNKA